MSACDSLSTIMALDAFARANTPLARDLARVIAERDQVDTRAADAPTQVMNADAVRAKWQDANNAELTH